MKKWFNVMIRCEGNMVDVFINGMVVKRHKLSEYLDKIIIGYF